MAVLRAFLVDGTIVELPYFFDEKSEERGGMLLGMFGEDIAHIAIIQGEVSNEGKIQRSTYRNGDLTPAQIQNAYEICGYKNYLAARYLGIPPHTMKYLRNKYNIRGKNEPEETE